jgi:hypothetical protein
MSDGEAPKPLRFSSLPIVRYCGYADTIGREYPESSGAAEGGTNAHSRLEEAVRLLNAGEDPGDEFRSMLYCLKPYTAIESEIEAPSIMDVDSGEPMTKPGRADIVLTYDDNSLAIGDYKNGQAGRVDPASDNLQVNGYGVALAILRGVKRYRPFIYFREGGFDWGDWVEEEQFGEVVGRIRAAWMRDRSRPVVGQHCDKCFSRKHCYAFMLPAHEGESALVPFTTPGGLTRDNAPQALRVVQAMKAAVEVAEARLKDLAREIGGIEEDGKRWAPVTYPGRRSISVSAVEEAGMLPELEAKGLVSAGRPYEAFGWRSATTRNRGRTNDTPSGWLAKEAEKKPAARAKKKAS